MAPVPYRLWAPLLLTFVFLASDNKGAELKGFQVIRQNGPWIRPRGDSDTAVSCTALEKLVGQLETEKQETTTLNSQLENEVSVLRKDLTHLRTQVATCGSSGSPAHQIQVQKKMKQYLETFDGETFLILKILSLTREVMRLQMKLSRALNSTDTSKSQSVSVLQKEVKDKTAELDALKRQLQGLQGKDLSQIYQIILLQNQIWSLDQLGGGAQAKSELTALQSQLDAKLRQLQSKDAAAAMLELISVQGKIGRLEQLMSTFIEESRDNYAVYRRQWSQKFDLLRKKIGELSRDINNTDITREIFRLQSEVDEAQKMMVSARKISQIQITEIRTTLDNLKKRQLQLQKEVEEADYVQAQMIWKILSTMKELIELDGEEPEYETSQVTTLQTLLQAREEELSKAQAEVKELRRKLQAGEETSYKQTQAEFDQAVAALTQKGESETADVLSVIRLQEEITALRDLITRTRDQNKLLELKNQLGEKQTEMVSKRAGLKKMPNTDHTKILEIIDLYSELGTLQKRPRNESTADQVQALQEKLDGLAGLIRGNEILKSTLRITFLQNQVDHLQQILSDHQTLEPAYINQLKKDLLATKTQLQDYVGELTEKNRTNAELILKVTDLHNQLRTLEEERTSDRATSSLTVAQLREQLREILEAQSVDQAKIKALQDKVTKCARVEEEAEELETRLSVQVETCLGPAQTYQQAKTGLEEAVATLGAGGSPGAATIFSALLRRTLEKRDGAGSGDISGKEFQDMLKAVLAETGGSETTKLILKIISLQDEARQLQRELTPGLQAEQKTRITKELKGKITELRKSKETLMELLPTDAGQILSAADLFLRLRRVSKEGQKEKDDLSDLRKQLDRKEAEQDRDRAEIQRLQEQLNTTEAKCSSVEAEVKGLQGDLQAKMEELQSKSDTVTSLALQVSTLTQQVADLDRRLQQSVPEASVKELQKLLSQKKAELANKTEELKERSAQPHRLLQIILLQAEIDELSKTAKLDMDFDKIKAKQDRLKELIGGIKAEEDDDSTKLMFAVLAQRDEIAKLKLQEQTQTQANLEKIRDLESKVEEFQQQIKDKTQMMDSSNVRVSDLTAEIMELHRGIAAMKDQISRLEEENANKVKGLTKRLELSQRKLKDVELLFQEANSKYSEMVMEIISVKEQLKKAQALASKVAEKPQDPGLEQEIETLKKENRRLETASADLKQQVQELNTCCSDFSSQCEDIERQLQQSIKDADYIHQQISKKEQRIAELMEELQEKSNQTDSLVDQVERLNGERQRLHDIIEELRENLSEKEDRTIIAKSITMDPNTAHPRVALAEDNTELYTLADSRDVPDHPGRYDVVLATLGDTGFSSGRRYWEVSVADRLCYHIGLAAASAQRKGILRFAPQQGYWTLILTKQGQLRALDRMPLVLPVQAPPGTLGVLLDYRKGQVSFYDTGSRSHLYSFSGNSFTDELFPFINFCNEDIGSQTPIRLIPPGSTDWLQ